MPDPTFNWIAVVLSIVTMVGVAIDRIVSSMTARNNRAADNEAARIKLQFDAEMIERKSRIEILEEKVDECEKKHKECEEHHIVSQVDRDEMKRRIEALETQRSKV